MKATPIVIAALWLCLAASASAQSTDLAGLWEASLRFGPDIRGALIIYRAPDGWRAEIAGFSVVSQVHGQSIAFELPDGKGRFRGEWRGKEIHGQWIQAPTRYSGRMYATSVTLRSDGPNRWRGTVTPFDDRFSWYMPVIPQPDGSLRTYLRNPDRNQGRFLPVSRITLDGAVVRLMGPDGDGALVLGQYEDGVITLPLRGGTYAFTRARDETSSPFYPRGAPAPRYRYMPPIQLDDGWPVGAVEDVGISRQEIERFVQMLLDMRMDSIGSHQLHSLLIARHGRLVVEEYFHGYHRDLPHETRSAAKSWTATLIGAAMQAGIPVRMDTPVYATMLDQVPVDLDPRKRAMTLEHLMAMTAGFNCDENDPASANEDVMDERGIENWYAHTLAVPLVSAPGETVFYCSTEPNLAGGMLAKIAGEPLPELFDRLVARPLQMRTYHLILQDGEAYGGGGHVFLPRDFLKMAQLLLHGGRWNNEQILPADWLRRIAASLRDLTPTQQYGYLWNSARYSHVDRDVRAYFAGGNGGQIFMAIPDLDLVIGFTGGNYADPATFTAQRVYVPRYILPAVK
jgi:CubicO group peptidase (beta-lactamase class C family)